jgi:hypothetical protein
MLILYSFGIDFLEEEFHGWHDGYEVSVVYYPSFVVTILGGTLLWDGQFSVESCWNAPRFFSHRV